MDVNKVTPGQRIAALAGGLLFIDLWMSWYSINTDAIPGGGLARSFLAGIDTTATAWQAFDWTDILLAITAVIAVAGAVMAANSMRLELPISWAQLTAIAGGIMTLIVLYRIINQPGDNKLINVEWGAYVGLVLTAAVGYGGWRAMSESGTTTAAAAPPPPAPAAPTA